MPRLNALVLGVLLDGSFGFMAMPAHKAPRVVTGKPTRRPTSSGFANARPAAATMSDSTQTSAVAVYPPFVTENMLEPGFAAPGYSSHEVRERVAEAVRAGGLAGLGVPAPGTAWPSKAEVLGAIPKECFRKSTPRSLGYAAGSLALTLACGALGSRLLPVSWAAAPLWAAYAAVTGTVATGCWVVAHECGHGAFSDNKLVQTLVGYSFHSLLLVPYFSWQRTHAVHHLNTNHVTEGETHVPPVLGSPDASQALEARERLGGRDGPWWPLASLVGHLTFGWPLYILRGASGGPKYGATSHFWPWGHSGALLLGGKELFPSASWKRRVLVSDAGVLAVLVGLGAWAAKAGVFKAALLYLAPLAVTNAWLVLYTWLQHTDVDVAHFDELEHSWVKGAFQTVDRPYGPLLNLLHHGIGSTHVLHHVCSAVPHYHAWRATEAIKRAFPDRYLFDPTPVHRALGRVARNCVAVEKLPGAEGAYIYTP